MHVIDERRGENISFGDGGGFAFNSTFTVREPLLLGSVAGCRRRGSGAAGQSAGVVTWRADDEADEKPRSVFGPGSSADGSPRCAGQEGEMNTNPKNALLSSASGEAGSGPAGSGDFAAADSIGACDVG